MLLGIGLRLKPGANLLQRVLRTTTQVIQVLGSVRHAVAKVLYLRFECRPLHDRPSP